MNKLQLRLIPLALIALAVLLACNLSTQAQPTQDTGAIYTQAAQTLVAQLTGSGPLSTPTSQATAGGDDGPQPTNAQPTNPQPTLPLVATATPIQAITNTPLPSFTPLPPTNTPRPTAAPTPCNWAKFVEDVTVPDNTKFAPGAEFTKIWELENIGSCTWTADYELVFVDGDRMGAARSVDIGKTVRPGESVNVAVDLIAPTSTGKFQGDWMLQDAEGDVFGIGQGADNPFFVVIRVVDEAVEEGVVYDFISRACDADWESRIDNSLPCPGDRDSEDGFVLRLGEHDQENQSENEPALWTNPDRNTDGYIRGEFPAVKIESGDRFLADVGCLAGNERCNVTFLVQYRVSDGPVQTLGEWREIYDGKISQIRIDLTPLAGKSASFILLVRANGGRSENAAFWLLPQISRP